MKNESSSPIVKLALIGIASIGMYYLSEGVKSFSSYAQALPVEGTVQKDTSKTPKVAPKLSSKESIHPILIESKKKIDSAELPKAEGPTKSLDEIFTKPIEQPLARLEQAVDLGFRTLKGRVLLQAVTNSGAILNGKFFETGALVTTAPFYKEDGVTLAYPRLSKVSNDTVVLKNGKGPTVTLKLTR